MGCQRNDHIRNQELNKLSLYELLGSLLAHELTTKMRKYEENKKKKVVTVKASTLDEKSDKKSENNKEITLITKKKL